MAGLYHGHLLEFPLIRVDNFTKPPPTGQPWLLPDPKNPSLPPRPAPNAQIFLLTHIHTDHLEGLSNKFSGRIICSADTKRLLLRLEFERDRQDLRDGTTEVIRRKYPGLEPRRYSATSTADVFQTLNYNEPTSFSLGSYPDGRPFEVTITMLDANHCPGFLITSPDTAVLHTGDVRADGRFRDALQRSQVLQPFLMPWSFTSQINPKKRRRLDRIYLDTSALLCTVDMPSKEDALQVLVKQLSLYPKDTIFFFNIWTPGWEEVIKFVAQVFHDKVHADRYKRTLYMAVETDPFLFNCTTTDESSTRFHACERYARCGKCDKSLKPTQETVNSKQPGLIVEVSMTEVGAARCAESHSKFLADVDNMKAGLKEWPTEIEVPIARHASFMELRALVNLFRPRALSPNTLIADRQGIDYFWFADLFRDVLPDEAYELGLAERDYWFSRQPRFGPQWLASSKDGPLMRQLLGRFGFTFQGSSIRLNTSSEGSNDKRKTTKRSSSEMELNDKAETPKRHSSEMKLPIPDVVSPTGKSSQRDFSSPFSLGNKRRRRKTSFPVNIAHLSSLAH